MPAHRLELARLLQLVPKPAHNGDGLVPALHRAGLYDRVMLVKHGKLKSIDPFQPLVRWCDQYRLSGK